MKRIRYQLRYGSMRQANRIRIASVCALGAFGVVLILAGAALAWSTNSWTSPWETVSADQAPCSGYGYDHYNDAMSSGNFSGYATTQATQDFWCQTNTAQHSEQDGFHSSALFTASSSGTVTVTAYFSGEPLIYADYAGSSGNATASFSIGVALYNNNVGTSVYNWVTVGSATEKSNSGTSFNVQLTSVSLTANLISGDSYIARAGISYLSFTQTSYFNGGTATAMVGFQNICYVNEGCSTVVTLNTITIS